MSVHMAQCCVLQRATRDYDSMSRGLGAACSMKTTLFAIASVLLIAVPNASADSLNVQPGQWKITRTYVRGPGRTMPEPSGPRTRCITKENLAEPAETFDSSILMIGVGITTGPPPAPERTTCEYLDVKETANSISFTYRCTGGYAFTREGSVAFDSPTHFHGHYVVQVTQGGFRPMVPEMTTEGTRIGDCVKTNQH